MSSDYFIHIHSSTDGKLSVLRLLAENASDAIVELKAVQRALQHIRYLCGIELFKIDDSGKYTHIDWVYTQVE